MKSQQCSLYGIWVGTVIGTAKPARLVRGNTVYAIDSAIGGRTRTILFLSYSRPLAKGVYTLVIASRNGNRWTVRKSKITVK